MKKFLVLLASSAEWYEFTIYTFCIDYIGAAFFPDLGSKFAIFLAAFGAFAAGFLAGLSQGKSLEICGKMGNISAGEVISSMGARPQTSLQDLFEINKL